MPNFLIVGAAKSGTTSLYQYLKQHPQIYMSPVKEPRFFSFENETLDFAGPGDEREIRSTITSLDRYRQLFAAVTTETAIGEASPPYLYIPGTPARIARHLPEAKIVAILRQPADRAYSNFMDKRWTGDEPHDDFSRAIDDEPRRIAENWSFSWHYVQRGYYYRQLRPFFDTFPRRQIRVFLFDELESDAASVLREILRFLEVDETFVPDVGVQYRISGEPKSQHVHDALRGENLIKSTVRSLLPESTRAALKARLFARNTTPQRISPEDHHRLTEGYRHDIEQLQDLLDRDLSAWLEAPSDEGEGGDYDRSPR